MAAMNKRILPLCLLALLAAAPLAAPPAHAATATPAVMTPADRFDVNRIADYLNDLKNVSADFLQIDDAGGMMRGTIAIARPGKMRVNYDPPNQDFIIADGSSVHIWDDALQAQTNVDQKSSLAHFILRDPVKMDGDVTVTKLQRFPAKLEITLVATKDPAAGSLTLVFEDKPLRLRQWKVTDPQGRTTGVNLQNVSTTAAFPDSYFVFTPPNFGKRTR
jgi:outer membrane lipoprotein-sorting protein